MPKIKASSIEELKSRVNIYDVVSAYVSLKKSGSSYKGLSPFTTEKTPSFFVHPDKNYYYCFSTSQGGDIISFIMIKENLSFAEAVEFLENAWRRHKNLKGVKLHPDIQAFKIDDYRCLRIYELCEERKLPILMHTGDNRYDYSNPNRLLPILQIYTGLTVIGAHLGGWSIWEEASKAYSGIPNFYVDCSSSFHYLPKETSAEIIRRYGTDRVLFGTDYPMWSAEKELEYFFSLGLDENEIKCILNTNVSKIFDLE